jgi:hypothetical protein
MFNTSMYRLIGKYIFLKISILILALLLLWTITTIPAF